MVPGSPAVSGDLSILFADLQGRIEEEATIMVPAGIQGQTLLDRRQRGCQGSVTEIPFTKQSKISTDEIE